MAERTIPEILADFGHPNGLGFADLARHMAGYPSDRLALEYLGEKATYGEVLSRVAGAAQYLEANGIGRGNRVAYMFPPNPYALYTMMGVTLIGGILVPTNHEMQGDVLTRMLERYEIEAVIVDPVSVDAVRKAVANSSRPNIPVIVGRDSEYGDAVLAGGDIQPFLARDYPVPSDPALLLSTSGTTGEPKGVVQAGSWVAGGFITTQKWGLTETPKSYLALSWGYAAVIWQLSITYFNGGSIVIPERFSASGMWEDFHAHNCNMVHLMGTMPRMLFNQPERPTDASTKKVLVTSAGMPPDIWEAFEERFNARVANIYTSVDGGGCWIGNDGTGPAGSTGKPWIDYEAKLVDEDGNEVAQGEVGELLMRPRGGTPVVNYWKDPEASAEKVAGGWVHMGDNFTQDEDGYFWFVDRKRDLIRRRAMGIAPAQIESVINKHPNVKDVAAIAVPSELEEDEVKLVVIREGELQHEELLAFAEAELPRYMRPKYIEFVESFPTTFGSSKLQRFKLREEWATSSTWDTDAKEFLTQD